MADVRQQQSIGRSIWQVFLLLTFAVWWGGLTFYAAIVVPIGSERVGATEQGFITQQVTQWHNALLIAMTMCLLVEAWRQKRWQLWAIASGLVVIGAALFVQHMQLTDMMDFDDRSVAEDFYSHHAIYLWLTTIEWAVGLTIPFAIGCRLDSDRKHEARVKESRDPR